MPVTIRIETNLLQVARRLRSRSPRDALLAGMQAFGQDFLPVLRAFTPKGKRQDGDTSAHARDKLRFRVRTEGADTVLEFLGPSYLNYVIGGTKPHVIEPRRASALVFEWKGGQLFFFRRVHHPGTKPNDFPMKAWRSFRATLLRALGKRIAAAMQSGGQ